MMLFKYYSNCLCTLARLGSTVTALVGRARHYHRQRCRGRLCCRRARKHRLRSGASVGALYPLPEHSRCAVASKRRLGTPPPRQSQAHVIVLAKAQLRTPRSKNVAHGQPGKTPVEGKNTSTRHSALGRFVRLPLHSGLQLKKSSQLLVCAHDKPPTIIPVRINHKKLALVRLLRCRAPAPAGFTIYPARYCARRYGNQSKNPDRSHAYRHIGGRPIPGDADSGSEQGEVAAEDRRFVLFIYTSRPRDASGPLRCRLARHSCSGSGRERSRSDVVTLPATRTASAMLSLEPRLAQVRPLLLSAVQAIQSSIF